MRSLVCAIAVLCATISAPHAERKIAAFGLLGGINLASFYGDDVKDVSMRFFPVVGANLTFNLPQILGLEIDALYASRGGAFKNPDSLSRNFVNTIKLHTFTVPVLFKFTLPMGMEASPTFFLGPAVAIPISQSVSSESVGADSNGQINSIPAAPMIPKEQLADYDILIVVGAGLEWGMGCVQFRANVGKGSLDKRDQVDVHTVTFDAMAGFTF